MTHKALNNTNIAAIGGGGGGGDITTTMLTPHSGCSTVALAPTMTKQGARNNSNRKVK